MRYGWKIEEIENRLKIPSNDETTKAVYQEMIDDYYGKNDVNDFKVTKSMFFDAIEEFKQSDNYNLDSTIAIYFGALFSSNVIDYPVVNLPNYPTEQIVGTANDFIKKHWDSYYFFKRVTNNGARLQHFEMANPKTFLGKSYLIHKNEYYMLINGIHGVQDTITLIHEGTHIEDYIRLIGKVPVKYRELSALTREHYGFDYMEQYEDVDEVSNARAISLFHYLARAIDLYEAVALAINLNSNDDLYYYASEHFDKFSSETEVNKIFRILSEDFAEEVDYVSSLILSLEIYFNCEAKEAPHFISIYQSGIRPLSFKIVDRIAPRLLEILSKKSSHKGKEKA